MPLGDDFNGSVEHFDGALAIWSEVPVMQSVALLTTESIALVGDVPVK